MEVGFSFEIREKIEFKYNGNDDDNVEGHEITSFYEFYAEMFCTLMESPEGLTFIAPIYQIFILQSWNI